MLNNKEGSIITFNDGTELYLFDHFYDEIHLFKSFLRQKLFASGDIEEKDSKVGIEKKLYEKGTFSRSEKINTPQIIKDGNSNITIENIATNNTPFTSTEKENSIVNLSKKVFRDSQFKRIRGIIIWLIPAYLIIKNIIVFPDSINTNGKIFIITVSLALIYYHSRYMNYFVLESDDLIIRNENFFWKKEQIELNDIFEIVVEKEEKYREFLNKRYMRIIYKDFSYEKYCADLIQKSTWENFKKELEKVNIPVRIEC
jgi:DNA polymerase III delta prime subunit